MKQSKLLKIAAIVAPLLVFCLWTGSYMLGTSSGKEIELKITGFDPRDLLSGHYLRYRVDYGQKISCKSGQTRCLCFENSSGELARVVKQGSCQQLSSCALKLKGVCKGSRLVAGIERYYFPEKYTKELRLVPPESTIKVSLTDAGKGIVKDLLVGGEPVLAWLRRNESKK